MMRYIWTINGKTITEEMTIPVKRGEVLRFELINDTMMSHPMHLHGHFFRLIMDPAKPLRDAPLKHTVDVPPMSRRTIEFLANEEKDWIFHCHNLYHMHGGMGRVVSYDDQGPEHRPRIDMRDHAPTMWMLDASLQNHMSMGSVMLQNSRNTLGAMWDIGWGHDHLGPAVRHDGGPLHRHEMPEVEYEIDLMWQRYISPRWSAMAGYRFTNMMDERDRAFAGAMYMLPGIFMATGTVDSEGEFRFGIAKNIQLTSRLGAFGRVEYDTGSEWMWSTGATYTLTKNTSLITQYDSDHGIGGGFQIRF
jgi:hypothetical protein